MLNLGIMDAPTYDIIMSRIESKMGLKIEVPSINVKDKERLRKIYQVKIMSSYGQWVKVIEKYSKRSKGIVFKSTQGFIDFLHRMDGGRRLPQSPQGSIQDKDRTNRKGTKGHRVKPQTNTPEKS